MGRFRLEQPRPNNKGGLAGGASQPWNVEMETTAFAMQVDYIVEDLGLIQLRTVQFVEGVAASGVEHVTIGEHG